MLCSVHGMQIDSSEFREPELAILNAIAFGGFLGGG